MSRTVVRPAMHGDMEEILSMVREMDNGDYLLEAWKVWMQDRESVQLVALVDGHIAGCVHGRFSDGTDAWAQGLRVRPDLRRRGIATYLMTALEEELLRNGARTAFATIGRFNHPSLATVARLHWKTALSVIRRRLPLGAPQSGVMNLSAGATMDLAEIFGSLRLSGFPASRKANTFFKRVYFSMTEEFLNEALARNSIKTVLPAAAAVLDPEPPEKDEMWVIAFAGQLNGLTPLFTNLAMEAAQKKCDLVVDSPDTAEIQALLDDLGFAHAGQEHQFTVVSKKLLP